MVPAARPGRPRAARSGARARPRARRACRDAARRRAAALAARSASPGCRPRCSSRRSSLVAIALARPLRGSVETSTRDRGRRHRARDRPLGLDARTRTSSEGTTRLEVVKESRARLRRAAHDRPRGRGRQHRAGHVRALPAAPVPVHARRRRAHGLPRRRCKPRREPAPRTARRSASAWPRPSRSCARPSAVEGRRAPDRRREQRRPRSRRSTRPSSPRSEKVKRLHGLRRPLRRTRHDFLGRPRRTPSARSTRASSSAIARTTGGRFFRARDREELEKRSTPRSRSSSARSASTRRWSETFDLYPWFLAPALACLRAARGCSARRGCGGCRDRRRPRPRLRPPARRALVLALLAAARRRAGRCVRRCAARARDRARLVAPGSSSAFLPRFSREPRARARRARGRWRRCSRPRAGRPGARLHAARRAAHAASTSCCAIDTSRSMLVQDLKPDRLDARASARSRGLLDRCRATARRSLAFAGDVREVAPLTHDRATLKAFVDDAVARTTTCAAARTSARAIEQRARAVRRPHRRARGDRAADRRRGPRGARSRGRAQGAAERGIRVYVVGMGTTEGGKIPDDARGFVRGRDGKEVVSSAWTARACSAIADATGGDFLRDRDVADPARGAVREAHRDARGPRARRRQGAHPARPLPVAAGARGGVHARRARAARAPPELGRRCRREARAPAAPPGPRQRAGRAAAGAVRAGRRSRRGTRPRPKLRPSSRGRARTPKDCARSGVWPRRASTDAAVVVAERLLAPDRWRARSRT